jgi:Family of unknown function (DUF5681)
MASRRSKSIGDAVGYGRPPEATQFKPGKSGNPKGRPKGSRSLAAVLQDVIGQKIPVTENGRTRRVPALEVMLRRLANDAMRSDSRAIKLLISLVDRYGGSPELDPQLQHLLAEDQEILTQYLESYARPAPASGRGGGRRDDR